MPNLSKLKDSEVAKAIEANYQHKVLKLKRLHGFYDANYKLQTDNGAYFLKIYGVDQLPDIIFQTDLIEKLHHSGLPVGVVHKTKTGKNYFKFKNTYGVIQNFLIGEHLDNEKINPKLMFDLGRTLGKVHAATKGKKFKGRKWKKYPWDLSQFQINASHLPKVKKYVRPEVYKLSQEFIEYWKKNKSRLAGMRQGVIHNDFHGRNLITRSNKCVGIFDFGDSMQSWYAADVAIAITHMCFFNPKKAIESSRAFLRGYFKSFGLTRLEKENLQFLIQMRACILTVEMVYFLKGLKLFYRKFFYNAVYILKYFRNPQNCAKYFELYRNL